MKMTVRISRPSPVEPELLAKFVIQRCREVTEPPPVVVALALAMVSRDDDFYDRLKDLISSSSEATDILRMCHEVFLPALGRVPDAASPDSLDRSEECPVLDERTCREVLDYALAQSGEMLTEKDFEFVRVVEFLIKAGLSCFPFRLYEFESVRDSFQDDPENLLRRGIEIIGAAVGSPQDEN